MSVINVCDITQTTGSVMKISVAQAGWEQNRKARKYIETDRTSGKIVSLIKLMRYITQNLELLPKYLSSSIPPPQIRKAVLRYCTYEKRNRPNFIAEMEAILMRTS